jgi:formate dehydrogenase major subunit
MFFKIKRHFSSPEMVGKSAVSTDLFTKSRIVSLSSGRIRGGCYAVGWTHSRCDHSGGAILQLLLEISADCGRNSRLRGHHKSGSTDIRDAYAGLTLCRYHGAMDSSALSATKDGLLNSMSRQRSSCYREAREAFGLWHQPKLRQPFFFDISTTCRRKNEHILMGQNPAVGAPNSRLQRKALSKLKWLVVREMVEIESANFWRESPEIERGELNAEDIETEVFFFPAAGHAEKEGAFTNTQRLLQWREKAVDPPGDARSDGWFIHQLALRLIAKAKQSGDPLDEPLRALDWWYPEDELGEPKMEAVLAEINGWQTEPVAAGADRGESDGVLFGGVDRAGNPHHGPQLNRFAELKADGSTACGAWIYSGVFGRDGVNKANSRKSRDYLGHGWGFSWPSDRRIIYNRASARPDGRPWSERKKLVWWDSEKWTGIDVAGFVQGKPPDYEPEVGAEGLDAIPGDAPFILHEDGLGWIYVPKGLKDGPFPTHYEPLESPVSNELYSRDTNPPEHWFARQENRFAPPGDSRFPFVLTTYRLTEHHTAGGMSRFLSHLAELQPEMFAEMSPELARELKIRNGDYVCIVTLRSAIEARALVSRRIRPLHLNGRTLHQVALPYHYGTAGLVRGSAANDLLSISGEPNVTIMEAKACTCNIVPGRLPRGRAFAEFLNKYAPQTGPPVLHPEEPQRDTTARGGGLAMEGKE